MILPERQTERRMQDCELQIVALEIQSALNRRRIEELSSFIEKSTERRMQDYELQIEALENRELLTRRKLEKLSALVEKMPCVGSNGCLQNAFGSIGEKSISLTHVSAKPIAQLT